MRIFIDAVKQIKSDLVEYAKYAKDSKEECYKIGIIIIILGLTIGGK